MSIKLHETLRSSYISSGGFLLFLVILQTVQLSFCIHNTQRYNKRLPLVRASEGLPADKRTLTSGSGSSGQPEEIFSASDQLESNYDEYPVS